MRRLAIAAVLVFAAAACGRKADNRFPEGLGPLDDENLASFPPGDGSNPYPEILQTVTGESGDYEFVHGKGYVQASLSETWDALQDPAVSADRRAVTEWSVTFDVEEGYDVSYRIHNVVEDVITVDFDITWRHGAVEGTVETPSEVAINYAKTDGTTFIQILRGSMLLYEVDTNVTALEMIEHLKAPSGIGPAVTYIRDVHTEAVLSVHGQPLPVY